MKQGDKVEVLCPGLAALCRAYGPDAPPNHFGVVEEVWDDGSILVLFDDSESSAPYEPALVRLRSLEPTQEDKSDER